MGFCRLQTSGKKRYRNGSFFACSAAHIYLVFKGEPINHSGTQRYRCGIQCEPSTFSTPRSLPYTNTRAGSGLARPANRAFRAGPQTAPIRVERVTPVTYPPWYHPLHRSTTSSTRSHWRVPVMPEVRVSPQLAKKLVASSSQSSSLGSLEFIGSFPQYRYRLGSPLAASIGSRGGQRAVRGSDSRAPTWYKLMTAVHSYP